MTSSNLRLVCCTGGGENSSQLYMSVTRVGVHTPRTRTDKDTVLVLGNSLKSFHPSICLCLSAHPSTHPSTQSSVCLSTRPSAYLSIHLPVRLFVRLFFRLCVCVRRQSVCLCPFTQSVHLFFHMSVSIRPCVCLSVSIRASVRLSVCLFGGVHPPIRPYIY